MIVLFIEEVILLEDSFKTTLFAFILIALFGMLILTAVVNVGNTYSKDTSEVAGGSLALDKFNKSISNVEQDAKDFQTRFSEQSIWSAIAGVVVTGIFKITLDMFNLILSPFALISNIMLDVLHIPTFVTGVVLGLLILGIILALWRLYKVGD